MRKSERCTGTRITTVDDLRVAAPNEIFERIPHDADRLYRRKVEKKPSGADRVLYVPNGELKAAQRSLLKLVLTPLIHKISAPVRRWLGDAQAFQKTLRQLKPSSLCG